MVGGKELAEELERKCHGLVRLQSGTNKLASQRGMTGFGTPRNNVSKPKWKQEWVEEWVGAEKEWKDSGRGDYVDAAKQAAIDEARMKEVEKRRGESQERLKEAVSHTSLASGGKEEEVHEEEEAEEEEEEE